MTKCIESVQLRFKLRNCMVYGIPQKSHLLVPDLFLKGECWKRGGKKRKKKVRIEEELVSLHTAN